MMPHFPFDTSIWLFSRRPCQSNREAAKCFSQMLLKVTNDAVGCKMGEMG